MNARMAYGRGFLLRDCGAVLCVATGLAAVLLIAGANQRRLGRLGDDLANLKTIGAGVAQYGAAGPPGA